MPRRHRTRRIRPSMIGAAFLLLSLLASLLAGLPAVAAPAPQISLVAAAASVTIDRYPDEPV